MLERFRCHRMVYILSATLLFVFGEYSVRAAAADQAAPQLAASPQDPRDISITEAQLLQVVRELVGTAEFSKARHLIEEAQPNIKDMASLDFLEAYMLEREGDLGGANALYRQILSRDPALERVRLLLARNLLIQKKDHAARYHYEYALAGDLPPSIQKMIRRNLAVIRIRQTWALNFGVSLTSNSNVSTGPDQSHVDMFGLPFELSQEARQTSGNGVSAWASGKWLVGDPREIRLRSEAGFHVVDHDGRLYDDSSVWISSGPQWQTARETIWLAATSSNRWPTGKKYQQTVGAKAKLERVFSGGKIVTADIAYRSVDYAGRTYDDGRELSLALSFDAALDARSRARVISRSGWYQTDHPAWSWKRASFGMSWMREFSYGITAEVTPEISVQRWASPHPAFSKVREDVRGRISFSFRRRDWRIFGFAPVVGFEYLNSQSTIELYRFDRRWMTMGVARSL